MLFRSGVAKCPTHGTILKAQTITQMTDTVMSLPEEARYMILSPVIRGRKGEYKQLFSDLARDGFIRVRVDGEICDLSDPPSLALRVKHNIEIVVDRFKVRSDQRQRVADSLEIALKYADGLAIVAPMDEHNIEEELLFSDRKSVV